MNKQDLATAVAVNTGLAKSDAAKAVDATLGAIADALKAGDTVRMVGFGSFSVASRPARTGRNPRTGQAVEIPAAKAPKFTPGQGLRDALSEA
jgi:DNA-binding protein HU-beta